MYELEFSKQALKQLKKMDKGVSKVILSWLSKNINHTMNPRQHGKCLTADKSNLWRYRVGDYRILVQVEDENLVVYAVTIGHRREVYK